MRVKICGITQASQGQDILRLGATDLGFICVPQSPRYISPQAIQAIIATFSCVPESPRVPEPIADPGRMPRYIGVFVDAPLSIIEDTVELTGLTGVQLHGSESPEFCHQLRSLFPKVEIIKAFRIRDPASLAQTESYEHLVDTLLLDAYHPHQWGGTGQILDWGKLKIFRPSCPWFLAGGLNADNVTTALMQLQPDGIDLSSGVEHAPGNKNMTEVVRLFKQLRCNVTVHSPPHVPPRASPL